MATLWKDFSHIMDYTTRGVVYAMGQKSKVNPRFKYRDHLIYPTIQSHTSAGGDRVYYTPAGDAPSVTTILATLPHPGLDEWRERVGEEEAARVSKEATDIGSSMHNMLEAYVRDVPYQATGIPEEKIAKKLFKTVRMMGLRPLEEVWGIEVALHYDNLFAGRTDLVGVYGGYPSIIDYKSAKYFKKAEYLEDYKLQTAAYALAHDTMFPSEKIEQAVLLIGTRPNPEYKVPPNYQRVVIPQAELEQYKDQWVEVLDNYYAQR